MLGGRGEYVRGHREVFANAKTALHKGRPRLLPGADGGSKPWERRETPATFGAGLCRAIVDRCTYGSPFDLRLQSSELGATCVALVGIVLGVIDAKAAKRPSGRNAEQQKRNRRSNQHDRDDKEVTH